MVQLTAKGQNRYVEANLPESVGEAEAEVVLMCLREAVDSVVALSASDLDTKTVLNHVVALRKVLSKAADEIEEMVIMVRVIEKRTMESI